MNTILHLGLGNFFRAHQAFYTATAPDAADWEIAAFTGRSPDLADALTAQHGRYTLVTRGPVDDTFTPIGAITAAYAGTDRVAWRTRFARPSTALVTLTVTEAAYRVPSREESPGPPSVAARLVDGLAARRDAGAGPIAIVPCDNLPGNGTVLARAVAAHADPDLARWIDANVSFVTTMVDRITPATTEQDIVDVKAATGVDDAVPVVTEPFHEWVISGEFPAGRPDWAARFVTDVTPHEQRKLWLLNGGHSLLAYAGGARGHETVAQSVADPEVRRLLEQWWDEAAACLPLPAAEIAAYRADLLGRFTNARIRHRLAQIAADGSQKIPVRILPVLRETYSRGRTPTAALTVLESWRRHLRGEGVEVNDPGAAPYAATTDVRELLERF